MDESLHGFLTSLPERTFDGPKDFERRVIPSLAERLGYPEQNLYFRVALEPEYDLIPDGVVARSPNKQPHLLLEADYGDRRNGISDEMAERLQEYGDTSNAEYVVLISPTELVIHGPDTSRVVTFDEIDQETVDTVATILAPPEELPDEPIVEPEPPAQRQIDADYFSLNLDKYEDVLDRVKNPDSNFEKGESLETLTEMLFEGLDATSVTEKNLYTETSELDVAVRHEGSDEYTLFDEYSRYVLVECKNWDKSVGAKQIRDFKGKLQASGVDLGVFVATGGVSGGTRGEYALGEIDLAFRNEGIAIVLVDGNDLEWIRNGNSFYDLLERKLYTLRFRRKQPYELDH